MIPRKWKVLFSVAALVMIIGAIDTYKNPWWSCHNLYVEQARSLLHGKTALDIGKDIDAALIDSQRYLAHPPTPVLLYLPAVAVFGSRPWIAYVYCFAALGLTLFFWLRICESMKIPIDVACWLGAALITGTGIWFCFNVSYSPTYNGEILSTLFVFAGIHEALRSKRAWVIGICLGAAATTRTFTGLSGILILVLALENEDKNRILRFLTMCGVSALPFFVFYMALNYARFGSPFDTGYSHIGNVVHEGILMSTTHIPHNLFTLFARPPSCTHNEMMLGTGLLFASPFFVYAFFAPLRSRASLAAWAVVLAIVGLYLPFAFDGTVQVNCARYLLDAAPALFFLILLGLKRGTVSVIPLKGLIGVSLALNLWFLTPLVNFCPGFSTSGPSLPGLTK
jgi:hypothetical protein